VGYDWLNLTVQILVAFPTGVSLGIGIGIGLWITIGRKG
jgi:hypothetical protein